MSRPSGMAVLLCGGAVLLSAGAAYAESAADGTSGAPVTGLDADHLEAHCHAAHLDVCVDLGLLREEEGTEASDRSARRAYGLACRGGHARACGLLGRLVEEGRGGASEPSAAARLYELAAAGSDPFGSYRLALLLRAGRVVASDPQRAELLLLRACGGGIAAACELMEDDIIARADLLADLPAPASTSEAPPAPPLPPVAPPGQSERVAPPVQLDVETIRRHVRRGIDSIRYCYERELGRQGELAGRVEVTIVIAPSGAVIAAALASSTLGNPSVEQCVVRAVQRLTFPAAPGRGQIVVRYPFVFSTGR